jgi:competence protein ComEC
MPALLLVLVLLLAGCVPGAGRGARDGVPTADAQFTLTALDVGQGDAFLLETPTVRVLVDGGEDGAAARHLSGRRVRHLDLVVATHGDLDHVGGLPDVLRTVSVGELWLHPSPDGKAAVDRLVAAARERGVPIRGPLAGAVLRVGDLTLEVLAPWPALLEGTGRDASNDASFVLRASAGGASVLLGGDSGAAVHRRLMATVPERLRADVLVLPHHGSATSDPALIEAVGPSLAVVSAGRDNRHGHPHREMLAELERLGIPLRRTDREGTVTVRLPARVLAPAAGAG